MQTLSHDFIVKLKIMIEARLIWYKHYYPFCDEIILTSATPPYWIIELSLVKFTGKALEIINGHLHTREDTYTGPNTENLFIAALLLRYERKELSWASFLEQAGQYTDSWGGLNGCEYYYGLLNELEDHEFQAEIEQRQCQPILQQFAVEIQDMERQYAKFLLYFRQYVAQNRTS